METEQPPPPPPTPSSLPPDTLDFAHRMFDAARSGDQDILLQAIDAGLPVNLTNAQGASFVLAHLGTAGR